MYDVSTAFNKFYYKNQIKKIQIDPLVDTYLANEERQIKKELGGD